MCRSLQLTESFDQGRDEILGLLGIPRPADSIATNKSAGRPVLGELSPRILDVLEELTQLDQRLYYEVLERRATASAVQENKLDQR